MDDQHEEMSASPFIRAATGADLPAILAITNDVIAHTTAIYAYEPQTFEEHSRWFANLKAGGWPLLVAEVEGEVSGFASIGVFRTRPAYKYTGEHSVHVHAAFRGRGIGHALLRALIEEAKRLELRTLVGGIDAENTASLKLHANLGFVETARMPQVAWKFGRWLDLIFVQRMLAGPARPFER